MTDPTYVSTKQKNKYIKKILDERIKATVEKNTTWKRSECVSVKNQKAEKKRTEKNYSKYLRYSKKQTRIFQMKNVIYIWKTYLLNIIKTAINFVIAY